MRSILDSQNLEAIRRSAEELAGIAPNFDRHLNLDTLSTDAYEYKLKVWQVFVPQNTREGLSLREIVRFTTDCPQSAGDADLSDR
uniref:hypothetical protein n=1 Tax=Kamptonema formosum TaxID=331992 RepID=UPI0003492E2B|nr:hypothetical protein [Oscillatoria sp. PCC 10802]